MNQQIQHSRQTIFIKISRKTTKQKLTKNKSIVNLCMYNYSIVIPASTRIPTLEGRRYSCVHFLFLKFTHAHEKCTTMGNQR